jgi:ectoine hydroxylase-related dioxygenase (phytanoyl-CoA dioxygenase family)
VRIKPPEAIQPVDPKTGQAEVGATPWHQDNGVVTEDADATEMITVWFPLADATVENGCLTVVPGSHRQGLHEHCSGRILERHFHAEEAVPLPMARGSMLLMTKRTIHNSLPNRSEHVRWSMDLRYHPVGQPTGRSVFPGFVARSRSRPETELHDPVAWNEMWLEARRALSAGEIPKYNRWDPNSPTCA